MSSRRRSAATTRDGSDHTSPVCQATSRPDSELAGFRQAEEGHVSPTAFRYLLRNTRARAYRRVTTAGPGARPASSPARAMATKTGPRRNASRRNGDGGGQRSSAHRTPMQRLRRGAVTGRLLSRRETVRFGVWNVRTLRGSSKTEQLSLAMKQYRLSCVAVTETHLSGASDSVDRKALAAVLRSYGVPHQLVDIIQELHTDTRCHVRTADGVFDDFQVKSGVRQGCVLSPLLFNCFMDRILREATEMMDGGLHVEYSTSGGCSCHMETKPLL